MTGVGWRNEEWRSSYELHYRYWYQFACCGSWFPRRFGTTNHLEVGKHRDARRFWQRFVGNSLTIVLPHYDQFVPHEGIGVIATGEVQGLLHLNKFLLPLVKQQQPTILADDIRGEELKTNLLVLGGPVTNRLYREVAEIRNPHLRFHKVSEKGYILINGFDHTEYTLSFQSETGEVTRDYCLINFFPNPYDPSTWVMLVAGLGTYGTWGGIELTTTRPFLKHKVVRSGKPFEAVVKIDVGQYKPIPSLLTIYSIAKK